MRKNGVSEDWVEALDAKITLEIPATLGAFSSWIEDRK
jgi:hypothetical protein